MPPSIYPKAVTLLQMLLTSAVLSLPIITGAHMPPTLLGANTSWHLVGPFPTSAHFLSPGADPNMAFGVDVVRPGSGTTWFPSELCDGGRAAWHTATADSDGVVDVSWPCVRKGAISEDLGRTVVSSSFGWAVSNFTLSGAEPSTVLVSCSGASVFYLNDMEMVGDPYALATWWTRRNTWLRWPIRLEPGLHELRVRVGSGTFACGVEATKAEDGASMHTSGAMAPHPQRRLLELTAESPSPFNPGLVERVPDVVGGMVASPFLSFPIVAVDDGEKWSALLHMSMGAAVVVDTQEAIDVRVSLAGAEGLGITAGQAVPVPIHVTINTMESHIACEKGDSLAITIYLEAEFSDGVKERLAHTFGLACLGALLDSEPFTFTFLDDDGSVQYASAVAPLSPYCAENGCPIVLAAHGAGVDASSPSWTKSLPAMSGAWLLFPSNRDKFGFDWQGVGLWNGLAALDALVATVPSLAPKQLAALLRPDPSRILFTGHSMGGHGCLVLATRMADRALGAACAAGWIRFDHYLPEWSALDSSFTDPYLAYLLSAAVASYNTDFMASHLAGIPFLARMGQLDDDVNPWNLRRMVRLLDQLAARRGVAQLSEVEGEGHWFGSIMNGEPMMRFFNDTLAGGAAHKPPLPSAWRVRHIGTGGSTRGGVTILQVLSPFVQAWIDVWVASPDRLVLSTANVRRISICQVPGLDVPRPPLLVIDGQHLPLLPSCDNGQHYCRLQQSDGLGWRVCDGDGWALVERNQWNAGPMRHVLRGRVWIVYGSKGVEHGHRDIDAAMRHGALNLANKLFMRGHGLARVLSDVEALQLMASERGCYQHVNILLVGGPCINVAAAHILPKTTATQSSLLYRSHGCQYHNSSSKVSTAAPCFSFGGKDYSQNGTALLLHGLVLHSHYSFRRAGDTDAAKGAVRHSRLLKKAGIPLLSLPDGPTPNADAFALIDGVDSAGIELAIRAFPVDPNSHVPDFLIVGKDAAWMGAGGILAAGYLGNEYEYRPDLSFPR